MSILIIGGAGYIGSHTVKYFIEQNEDVIIVDNLLTGHKEAVLSDKFYNYDIRDKENLDKIFKENDIEAVIHFAANSLVGESMVKPYEYYHNNVYGMMCLLDVMKENNATFGISFCGSGGAGAIMAQTKYGYKATSHLRSVDAGVTAIKQGYQVVGFGFLDTEELGRRLVEEYRRVNKM